jgi:hypothetical protein
MRRQNHRFRRIIAIPERTELDLGLIAGHFSLDIGAYWGKEPIRNGSWNPPEV